MIRKKQMQTTKMTQCTTTAFLAWLLAISMLFPTTIASAKSKVSYKISGTTLTISGKGEMPASMTFGNKKKTKNIKKVVIKKGVTTISQNAFKNCKKLKKVQMPSTITKISRYAFYNTALEEIRIPNSVKYIGNYSFYKCKKLKKIITPATFTAYDKDEELSKLNDTPLEQLEFTNAIDSLNKIGIDQFATKSYTVYGKDKKYSSYNGCIYNKEKTELIQVPLYADTFTLNKACTTLDLSAFAIYLGDDNWARCRNLNTILIPPTVTKITGSTDVFPVSASLVIQSKTLDNDSLAVILSIIGEKELTKQLPEQVKVQDGFVIFNDNYLAQISSETSSEMTKANCITIPEGITAIGNYVFSQSEMNEVNLPSTLQVIGKEAFSDCHNLTQIKLPDSITTIENRAFSNCDQLTTINFPTSLKHIGEDAFYWTEIGSCIPPEWKAQSTNFYFSYKEMEQSNKEYTEKHKNANKISVTEEPFDPIAGAYTYKSQMEDQYIQLNMTADGLFYYRTNQNSKLYDVNKQIIKKKLVPVKTGDVLYIKTPAKIDKTFKIYDAYIISTTNNSLNCGEEEQFFVSNGSAKYITFQKETTGGTYLRIIDLKTVQQPNIKITIQKKSGAKWTSISKELSIKEGKNWDAYTHLKDTYAKDIRFAGKKGDYRIKLSAPKDAVCKMGVYEETYAEPGISEMKYGRSKKKAVDLRKVDKEIEWNSDYYRYGIFYYEDTANTRWYRFKKEDSKPGILSIENSMFASGDLKVTIYKKEMKQALKTYCFDEKHMKPAWNDTKTVNYKIRKQGTYYIKVERKSKKATGNYGISFNYKAK